MDVFKDKSWVKLRRIDNDYQESLNAFLDHAFATSSDDNEIPCPCAICANRFSYDRETVRAHLTMKHMDVDYQKCVWVFHGESFMNDDDSDDDMLEDNELDDGNNGSFQHDMHGMIEDAFENREPINSSSGLNEEAKTFFKLLEDAGQPLYPGCEEFSKLSFIVEMYNLKCLHGVTNGAFNAFVKLFKRALPKDSTLPDSFKKMQRIIKHFGLGYKKIDACPNDCVLFWKDKVGLSRCPECNAFRHKTADDGTIMKLASGKPVPAKILRHFPLIPRLKRLYLSSKTAPLMTWHANERKNDGKLRHPADAYAWKDFDNRYPEFGKEPRNVRLCLASDGFNPFGNLGTQYSIWPVLLMTYNLPPWLCLKQPYTILSLLIPGPKGPGNDIDVYLEPLIDELVELWEKGVETYDASKNESFFLQGALLSTTNDFPAYGNLSGWKTKGKHACPYCNVDTCSLYLKRSRKMCYMGHRRFLPGDHAFRRSKKAFNGVTEMRPPPKLRSGTDLLDQMEGLNHTFGKHPETIKKNKRNQGGDMPWKKKSIFFQLPYWEHLLVRHHLDVMHVEKNVSENILGTLLGIEGKTKDTLQSRLDLVDLKIRHNLHPVEDGDKTYIPPACFTLSKKEKEEFIRILASVKVPDGYAANIKRRIVDGKIYGLKSHDHHVIMQQLLPLVARKMENKNLGVVLIELSSFFKELCSKDATPRDFKSLQERVIVTLCHLERIFLPSFFDIMVHLLVHLPYEAMVTGPVVYHWMYPIERDLRAYKWTVRNKARPEGSIAEGYIAIECLTFCARYLHGVETKETRSSRNNDCGVEAHSGLSVFSLKWCDSSGEKDDLPENSTNEEAHTYVLFNCEEVLEYEREHFEIVTMECQGTNENSYEIHRKRFSKWFESNVSRHLPTNPCIAADLKYLSTYPETWVKKMKKITCNGYKWRIRAIDNRSVTQNSGVLVNSITNLGNMACYGVLTEIVQLIYPQGRSVILFRCDWVDPNRGVKQDVHGFTLVNLKSRWKTNEPFILASQAIQVFYTPESKEKNWHVVIATKPRDLFEMEDYNMLEVDLPQADNSIMLDGDEFNDVRDDIVGVIVDEGDKSYNDADNYSVDNTNESDDEDETLHDFS